MRRLRLAAIFLTIILISGAVAVFFSLPTTHAVDSRLARGRAFLDAGNHLGALEVFRSLIKDHANQPEALNYLGAAYLRLHLYQAAIKELKEAARRRPQQPDPWFGLARAHLELGDPKKALDEARRAAALDKDSADAWILLGQAYWLEKNYAEAERAGLKAQQIDPKNAHALELLLRVYFEQNQPDRFEALLERASNPPKSVQDLAVSFYIRQGRFSRARDLKIRFQRHELEHSVLEMELAADRDPTRLDLYPDLVRKLVLLGRFLDATEYGQKYRGISSRIDLDLAKAFWMLGRKSDAVQFFRRASDARVHKLSAEVALAAITGDLAHWEEAFRAERVEKDDFVLARLEEVLASSPPLVRAFAWRYAGLYDSAFYNKSAEEALKVLESKPRNFYALLTSANAYQKLGRLEDATRYLERAEEAYPGRPEPAARMGGLAIEKKDAQAALAFLEKAVRLAPNHAGDLYNLGWLYDQLGNTNRAISLYRRAIEASPLSFEAMNNLALLYGNSRLEDRARELLLQAIRSDPDNEVGYFNLANYYARRREWRLALENYERALKIDPSNVAVLVEEGRVYLSLGESDRAIESLNNALSIDSHDFAAYLLASSAYEKMGHYEEAMAAAEEARRIRPESPELAKTMERLRDHPK